METRRTNLNSASEQELTQLPRIGADKARRIVHYPSIRKGFRDWLDFADAPGITASDVEMILTRAWIGPPAKEDRSGPGRPQATRGPAMVRRPRNLLP